jgi:tetratricopeptide (TPR) repeat protein
MSANTTPSAKNSMDCTIVARDEILEGYLSNALTDEDRDAFEEHYFGCARCFDELQTLKAIRDELPRTVAATENRRWWMAGWPAAAALAAAVVLAVGAALWMRPAAPDAPATAAIHPPSQAQQPAATSPPAAPATAPVAAGPSIAQLARFEPPRYEPLTLRGTPDEATARFQRGMEHYRKGDYARAAEDLRVASTLDPDAAHSRFFLGIAHLLLKQDDAGIDRLQATIALGDSPYLEDAHFYLAKAFLRRQDSRAAETQLKKLIQLGGSRTNEARGLLAQIQKLNERSN